MIRYLNFTLVLTGYKKTDDSEFFFVRVDGSADGSYQLEKEATRVEIPSGFHKTIKRLESRDLPIEELIAFGETLSSLLLPLTSRAETRRSVRDFYHLSRGKLKPEYGLRIQIRAEDTELGKIPWEYVYVPNPNTPPSRRGREGFLALDRKISIVRFENLGEPTDNVARQQDDLRVTVMLSDGRFADWPKLNLDQEEINILQALEGVDGVELKVLRPGTLEQLESLLTSTDSTEIFHFSGHGKFEEEMGAEPGSVEGSGYLILTDENGKPFPLEAQKLAADLKGRGVRLAVLGACEAAEHDLESPWSGVASALVSQGIPAVVGMRYTVRDESAIAFSRRFYQAMAAGKSIDSAVSEGRLGIYQRAGSSDRDWGVPVAYMGNDDPVLFPKPMGPVRKNLGLFALTSVFMVVWFYVHAHQFVAYKLAALAGWVGVGITAIPLLIVAVKLIGSTVIKTWKWREKDTWFESLLRHPFTARILWSALVIAFFMLLTTISISLDLDTEDYDEVEISIDDGSKPWRKLPFLVTNRTINKTLDGGIFFRAPWSGELKFLLTRPFGYKLKTGDEPPPPGDDAPAPCDDASQPCENVSQPTEDVPDDYKFGFWRNIKLKASNVLEQDDSRAIRLVMVSRLHDYLSDPQAYPESCNDESSDPCVRYELRISVSENDTDYIELEPYVLHKGMVYFGTHESILSNQLGSESKVDRREELRSCLPNNFPNNINRADVLDTWISYWKPDDKDYYQYKPGVILKQGQTLKVGVYEIEEDKPAILFGGVIGLDDLGESGTELPVIRQNALSRDGITTICMDLINL